MKTVCIFGGTGFIGSRLVYHLANAGYSIRVPTRHRERHRELCVAPGVRLVEADVYDERQLDRLIAGSDYVVNLVGILNETGRSTFRRAHVDMTQAIVDSMARQGIRRLLHMSALNADAALPRGEYLRTKGEAEALVQTDVRIDATVFRPSVVFGPDDSFFNRFALLLRLTPGVFPLACAGTRFAPVYVADVAEAFRIAMENDACIGKRYDLCGPGVYTLGDLVRFTARQIGVRRLVVGLPDFAARLQALVLGMMPGKPFSMDNYYSLQYDSVCVSSGLIELGIEPRRIETIVPTYLGKDERNARLQAMRRVARRGD
jgi:NADH dehydrogenase